MILVWSSELDYNITSTLHYCVEVYCNQALHILYHVAIIIIYTAVMQYYSVKHKHTSNESGSQDQFTLDKARKVKSISK